MSAPKSAVEEQFVAQTKTNAVPSQVRLTVPSPRWTLPKGPLVA
jgi:hypothetical protein